MRKLLYLAALGATLFATTSAPAPVVPLAARPATLDIQPDVAPWEPAPVKQPTSPAPVMTLQFRRRRRYVLADDYRATPMRPAAHRYNRSARRHARNGWRRAGY